jgi:hypothetical protein
VIEQLIFPARFAGLARPVNVDTSLLGIEHRDGPRTGAKVLVDLVRNILRQVGGRDDFDGEIGSTLNDGVRISIPDAVRPNESNVRDAPETTIECD